MFFAAHPGAISEEDFGDLSGIGLCSCKPVFLRTVSSIDFAALEPQVPLTADRRK
jgi:hypothetical protein